MRPPLFLKETFTSHAGLTLHWKIECDALRDEDWQGLAQIASEILPPFRGVHGVPRGGLAFAHALGRHATPDAPNVLIADDVMTTGGSMIVARDQHRGTYPMIGVVAFARCRPEQVPDWITPVFQLAPPRDTLGVCGYCGKPKSMSRTKVRCGFPQDHAL